MNDLSDKRFKLPARLFLLAGLAIIGASLVYLTLIPKRYQAKARLKVLEVVTPRDLDRVSDLQRVSSESELARSAAVLDAAIEKLNLRRDWGRRYNHGQELSGEQTRELLKGKASIQQIENSSLIEIKVTSEDRRETALIANEIARAYLDASRGKHANEVSEKIAALKKQWDAQNQKLSEAQNQLDTTYFNTVKARAANQKQLYDADAYELLLSNRLACESLYVGQSAQLNTLKKLNEDQLIQVLPSVDTNSPITSILLRYNKAQNELTNAKETQAPDSREVTDAALVVKELKRQLDNTARTEVTIKESNLAGLKFMLDDLNTRVKNATTNAASISIDDADYKKASNSLQMIRSERDDLQRKINEQGSSEALGGVAATLIDSAEVPLRPFVPSLPIGLMVMSVGAAALLISLVLFLVNTRLEKT